MENIQDLEAWDSILGSWDLILEQSEKSNNRSEFLEECLRRATLTTKLDIMKKLIDEENVNPNSKDNFGTTSIHIAARQRTTTTLNFFLSISEKVNINIQDQFGETPLILACLYAKEELVQVILRFPTLEVNLANNEGKTALLTACNRGHETMVSMLLGHEHIQVNMSDSDNNTPLMVACGGSYLGVIRLLLNREDIDINAKNKFRCTALTISCRSRAVGVSERSDMESIPGIPDLPFLDIPDINNILAPLLRHSRDMAGARDNDLVRRQPVNISMLLQREDLKITSRNLQAIADFVMNTFNYEINLRDARDMRALIEEAASKNLLDITRWLLKTEGYLLRESTATSALWGSSVSTPRGRPLRRKYVKGDKRQKEQTLQQLLHALRSPQSPWQQQKVH